MDWKGLEGLLAREFHPSLLLEHAQQWIKHPIANIARADPLISLTWIALAIAAIVYILNFATSDYSWTDRIWSITPIFYVWFFALSVPGPNNINGNPIAKIKYLATNHPRPLLMAVLVTIWGIRLTFNFARKGGYGLNGEDYRWKHVHGWKAFNVPVLGPLLWQIFSFGFIAFYQHVLIFMFTTPAYVAYRDAANNSKAVQSLTIYDLILSAAFLVFLAIETIADEQQWRYYIRRDKYRALPKAEQNSAKWANSDEARGFNTSGLFAYSRHPNFFAEQSLWITFYLFAVAVTKDPLHWSGLGVLQLVVCIFLGSTDLTEKLTAAKYPAYRIYQKYVSRTIPMPFKRTIIWDETKKKQ